MVAQTAIDLYSVPAYTITQMYALLKQFYLQNAPRHGERLTVLFPYDELVNSAKAKHKDFCEKRRQLHQSLVLRPVICDPLWGKTRKKMPSAFHSSSPAANTICDLGNNSGNLLFVDSVYNCLTDSKAIPLSPLFASEIKPGQETVIIPAANWLIRTNASALMQQCIDFLERTDAQVTCVGLGAQSSSDRDTPAMLAKELTPEHIRFVRLLSERAVSIGVRGKFTAQVLEELGVYNYRIIGCPSCFWSFDGTVAPLPTPSADKVLIHVTSGNKHESHLVDLGIQEDAGWVMQMLTELPQLSEGTAVDDVSLPYPVACRYPALHHLPEELRAYMMKRARVFGTMKDWQAYHQSEQFTFAVGSRFHGNMMALRSGIPALWITHDSRTKELVETLHLPHVSYAELDKAKCFADLIPYCDYSDFYANIGALTKNFSNFLDENNLQHRYHV